MIFKIFKKSFFFILFLFLALFFSMAFFPHAMLDVYSENTTQDFLKNKGYSIESFEKKWEKSTQIKILETKDCESIPTYLISPSNDYSNKTIILIHWHSTNHKVMYPIAEIFLDKGYNVLMYDQRSHGGNSANTVTFGYYEKNDLIQVVDYVNQLLENRSQIGVLGQSMGAATLACYLGTEHGNENIDFAILDSPFNNMYDEIEAKLKAQPFPLPAEMMTKLGNISNEIIYGYSYLQVNPEESIKTSNVPILIIHSKEDQVCPYNMGESIFNSITSDKKQMLSLNESKHVEGFWTEKELYINTVYNFIDINN